MRHSLFFGFAIGFLFGTVGMWILSMLSLVFQPIELVSQPLFAFGRMAAGYVESDGSAGNVAVATLFIINGLFYGAIGALIQLLTRRRFS